MAGGALLLAAAMRYAVVPAHATEPLALSSYCLTFDEPFNKLDVSPWGPGTRWIAHTPWNGDFGDATFVDPGQRGPFKVYNGKLSITMTKVGGHWQSGLLASVDRGSRGFSQSGGYFEMRAKLPGGAGVWPAFWLGSAEMPDRPHPEIDIIEYYGHNAGAYVITVHLWRAGKSEYGQSIKVDVPPHSLEKAYHLYGVAIDADYVVFYLDRREVGRLRSRPEFLQPTYVLVNLGAGGGWPITGIQDPSVMLVDYIKAYQHREILAATAREEEGSGGSVACKN